MPDTLKKLREPAALAAVAFAGLTILAAVVNLLVPPSSNGVSEPFANRAFDQVGVFLDVVVAAAAAFSVYLANHVAPALAKARLITMVALAEAGVALLFGVVTALALWGADGEPGESKFLRFLTALGGGAVVAVAALFVWLTWQGLAPPAPRPAPGGQYAPGGWQQQGGPAAGQQYPPQAPQGPPPGGFGWSPQQQPGQPGQPGQSGPTAFGQQQAGQNFDRTQLLPPVPPGQPQPGQPGPAGYPPQPPQPGAASGAHQPIQPPVPPTMQGYAAQPSPWSPGGPGASGQHGLPPQGQQQPPTPPVPPRPDDEHSGPFPIGEWRSE
jgi:hypothetical protein